MDRKDAQIGGGDAESVVMGSSSWLCQNLMVREREVKPVEFGVDPNGLVRGSETEPVGS